MTNVHKQWSIVHLNDAAISEMKIIVDSFDHLFTYKNKAVESKGVDIEIVFEKIPNADDLYIDNPVDEKFVISNFVDGSFTSEDTSGAHLMFSTMLLALANNGCVEHVYDVDSREGSWDYAIDLYEDIIERKFTQVSVLNDEELYIPDFFYEDDAEESQKSNTEETSSRCLMGGIYYPQANGIFFDIPNTEFFIQIQNNGDQPLLRVVNESLTDETEDGSKIDPGLFAQSYEYVGDGFYRSANNEKTLEIYDKLVDAFGAQREAEL